MEQNLANMQNLQSYRAAYNNGKEILPDYVYDTLEDVNDMPIDDIGQGELIDHAHFMGSLPTHFLDVDNVTTDILASTGVTTETANYTTRGITLSYKVDGVPGSCIYGPTGWIRSVSRGKRFKGFVMNDAMLSVLPQPLQSTDHEIDFRGEFLLSRSDFEALNALLPEDDRYANPRSMVSATINAKQPDLRIVSKIKWLAHAIWDGMEIADHFEELEHWFKPEDIVPYEVIEHHRFFANCKDIISKFYAKAMTFNYPVDGIVIQYRATAENNGRCNLDRVAIKQFDEAKFSGITEVAKIEWRLANNGSYFPRIWFKPIVINGSDVLHAAGYCWDYLNRMGLSIGASVVVTMRGGVIPYVSSVLHIGNGDYQFPADAAKPEPGDMQIWSTNSEDAVQRLRFIRGMEMLDLKDCGVSLFSDMYDLKFKSLFDVAREVKAGTFAGTMLQILPDTQASTAKILTIADRFTTFNYVWLLLALRKDGIGFKAANAIGQHLSGYHLVNPRELEKKAVKAVLADTELLELVKAYSKPVALEHADMSAELHQGWAEHTAKKKVCMSKKPTNGMKKAEFAATYLQDYEVTDNIKEADLLVCPAGENSNKIRYAMANNIAIQSYEHYWA